MQIKFSGILDKDTISLMMTPRCGVKDKIGAGTDNRSKRYALQGKNLFIHLHISSFTV